MTTSINIATTVEFEPGSSAHQVADLIAQAIKTEATLMERAEFIVDPLTIKVQREGLFGTGKTLILTMTADSTP